MDIKIYKNKVSVREVKDVADATFGDMAKGVVDLRGKIMALGGFLHADCEAILLKEGCRQEDLWGFNIYPGRPKNEWLEYTSLINIRPRQGNRSIEIKDPSLRDRVKGAVEGLIA